MTMCMFLGNSLIPSTKTATFIVAGTAIIDMSKDEDFKRIAKKSGVALERFIDNVNKESEEVKK